MMEEIGKAGGQMAMQLITGLMKGLAGGAGGGGGDGAAASPPSKPGEDMMPPAPPKIEISAYQ
ncbi:MULTISPECIES: hypothetical protein [Pseudomonas fluorescens group]|uniref:Uncharacterized protein n=4 Tax=Pseudomonas fluorescens group TaxID=136843 RepID=A0A3M3WLP8_PSEMA|nr:MULTISPECIES: hypothetical protein [Pseudomonas fluorescens group]MBZ6459200.1 hypothetical protein [Pseudomonas fluorescens group sp.]MBZ6464430.1 hypothetical protein [Pseudomonas fluorescens group sp.]MBZ6471381.1 hypothetical protein [Pseudomonas fluorescens group sp.]MCD7037391.1 hypothetical protein [Pseudomonas petroselini]MCD7043805.1 hypothetical protein [Pseudomonas petroselini]